MTAHLQATTAGPYLEFIAPRLSRYLTFVCASTLDAEDVFQEVCMAVHRNWKHVRNAQAPWSWLIRTAHNAVVNRWKRLSVERRALRDPRVIRDATIHDDTQRLDAEFSDAIRSALDSLDYEERLAVCLKVWAESSWVEIAEWLATSPDTAARRCAAGLKRMKRALKDFAPEPKEGQRDI